MKWFLSLALFITALHLGAQVTTNKLPQLGYDDSGLSEEWSIGDNAVKKSAVKALLLKNQNSTGQAYQLFLDGNSNSTASWLWLASVAIGTAMASFAILKPDGSPTSSGAFIGYGLFAAGTTGALVCSFKSVKDYRLAVKEYNHFAGY